MRTNKLWISGVVALLMTATFLQTEAQTTVTTTTSFSNNNGSGITTFNFENTNAYPVVITDVSAVLRTSGSNTFYIWYNTTPVSGAPAGAISALPDWIAVDTNVMTSTSGSTSNQTEEPVFTGLNLIIPPNTVYGIAIGGFNGTNSTSSGSMGYYTIPSGSGTIMFSGGGCNIIAGDNISYGATSYTATTYFHPRGFVGSLTFEQLAVPDNAGIDSLIAPDPSVAFCSGYQDVTVRLRNFGLNAVNSVDINWSIDGVLQPPVSYAGVPLDPVTGTNTTAAVTLGTVFFPFNTPVALKVWTSMPNGVADNDNDDDTLSHTLVAQIEGVNTHITPGDTAICNGTPVVLNAGTQPAGTIFQWNTGDVNQIISADQPGTYWVKIQSVGGCEDYDTVQITALPQPIASSLVAVDQGDNNFVFDIAGAQNVADYSWNFGDNSPIETGAGPKTHHYDQPGIYTTVATLQNGCNELVLTKTVEAQSTTSIADRNQDGESVDVYPNPASKQLFIKTNNGATLQEVQIYDGIGRLIRREQLRSSRAELTIADLPAGVYRLVIDTTVGTAYKVVQVTP